MRKRTFVAAFTAAALSIAALSGCGSSAKSAETTAKAETEAANADQESTEEKDSSEAAETTDKDKKDLREVNVVLDWYPNAIHTFLYTAIERGYYEEEGLNVQIRFPSNANDALSMVAAGKAEIGMYYQQDLIQAVVNHEVPQMEEEGFELNYFPVSGYGIPNYYEEVFLTSNKLLEEEPDVVAGFLRASKRGFDDFKADPDGCLAILMNNQNEANFPLTQSVEEQSCKTLLPLMETADAEFLSQTEECWQENIDWMLENGLIDQNVDVADVMTVVE